MMLGIIPCQGRKQENGQGNALRGILFGMKSKKINGHPALWATLTILAFPIVATTAGWWGMGAFKSFFAGAAATIVVLILEAMVRGRWWMAEPAIAALLNDADFSRRLVMITILLVFIFQTLILTSFLANPSMDRNVMGFILKRQCVSPTGSWLAHVCEAAARKDPQMNAALMQIRTNAEQRFFANGFATCAVRTVAVAHAPQTSMYGAIVRCDQWELGTVTRTPMSTATETRQVIALLTKTAHGTYEVSRWEDDPTQQEWLALGGELAVATQQGATDAVRANEYDMKQETLRRAFEALTAQ
jgi:hypothetical protein